MKKQKNQICSFFEHVDLIRFEKTTQKSEILGTARSSERASFVNRRDSKLMNFEQNEKTRQFMCILKLFLKKFSTRNAFF
jgi:hypothetical protein